MASKSKEDAIKESKFSKYMKAPIRFLIKARDFYIQSMTQWSTVAGYGSAMGFPSGHLGPDLSRSFSATTTVSRTKKEDYKELLRLASMRNFSGKIGGKKAPATGPAEVRRSCSAGIGRIDEDKECEFGVADSDLYARSRSYDLATRKS